MTGKMKEAKKLTTGRLFFLLRSPCVCVCFLLSLRYTLTDRLQINPTEHPVLLAEPNFNSKACREKSLEIMFETFQPPAVFLSKNACLSSYSAGRPTSLVIDVGHQTSVAAAVHDGYLLE